MSENIPDSNGITSDDKLWGLLSYIFTPIIPLVILLMEDKKNRPFIKSHYVQALVWGIAAIILVSIFSATFILSPLATVIGIAAFVFSIIWGIKAYHGEYVIIPVITNFVKKQNWA
jgi:uncharacterized membrane protein